MSWREKGGNKVRGEFVKTGKLQMAKRFQMAKRCSKWRKSYLSSGVLTTGLLVGHDTVRGGEDEGTELTGRKELVGPLLNVVEGAIEAGGDDTRLVQAAQKVDDDLAGAVVIDNLELSDVTVLLHQAKESNDHLGGGAKQNLTLSAALGVGDRLEGVGQRINKNHFEVCESY